MLTRDNIRDAASTLAHHWASKDRRDRLGVERIYLAFPVELQRPLGALVMRMLELRGLYTAAAAWEGLLFELAGLEPDNVVSLPGTTPKDYADTLEDVRAEMAFSDLEERLNG